MILFARCRLIRRQFGNRLLDDAAIGEVVAVPMYMNFNPGTLRLPVAWRVAWRLPSVWLPPDSGLRWRLA